MRVSYSYCPGSLTTRCPWPTWPSPEAENPGDILTSTVESWRAAASLLVSKKKPFKQDESEYTMKRIVSLGAIILVVALAGTAMATTSPDAAPGDRIGIVDRVSDNAPDWVTDRVTDRMTDRTMDHVTDRISDRATDRMSDRAMDRIQDHVSDRPMDPTTDRMSDRAMDRIQDPMTDRPMDHATDQMTDRAMDRTHDQARDMAHDQSKDDCAYDWAPGGMNN
jgi:hypothetical protein